MCTAIIVNSNIGMGFSVQSVPKYYKQDSRINNLVVRQSSAGRKVSTEGEYIVEILHQATTSEDTAD
jgi:hypothetical protein